MSFDFKQCLQPQHAHIYAKLRVKIPENSVRDQGLNYLNRHHHCTAWIAQNEVRGADKRNRYKSGLAFHPFYMPGVSDINGWWKGIPLYIEVKRPKTIGYAGGTLSENQINFLTKAYNGGCIAFAAWSFEDIQHWLPIMEKQALEWRKRNFFERQEQDGTQINRAAVLQTT